MEEAKKLKTEHDRLSRLSDDLLCHILTFLPIKEAYRTSVLSSRWISLCNKILDLQFALPKSKRYQEIEYVYTILLRRTENIRKLTFFTHFGCEPTDAQLWVMSARKLQVKELDLDFILRKPIVFPVTFFMSMSLVVLKLRGNIKLQFDSSIAPNFPSLKILHLQLLIGYNYSDDREYDINNFLSGCPHLEEFRFYDCLIQPINISFHFLKRLHLNLFNPSYITDIGPLQINVPSLEFLQIADCSLRKYEFINLFNVDRAALCISKYSDFDGSYKLLKGISNVKSLTLRADTIKFLSKQDYLDDLCLLTFHNLLYLSVEISENCNWNMLLSFLQNAPKLKNLVIEKHFKRNLKRKEVGNSPWKGPIETPTCLSSSLKTFQFKGIQNIRAELDFTQYIIENSSKLEKVKIFTPKSKKSKSTSSTKRKLMQWSKKSSLLVWEINLF
ncbi:F-box/FBD/LRR-repeat protein At4g26340-like [Cicer arietinum]|uniref:F-box/FBD/LRR-repeat protein At4g26340-like n=1 Tax=Cicer arietinum TaxID=3827 RepID=A0A1S2Z3F0_CICAR|nr:F-box/FBD/LRR-repeat protein At4g26340-like [Cicer arietinum]